MGESNGHRQRTKSTHWETLRNISGVRAKFERVFGVESLNQSENLWLEFECWSWSENNELSVQSFIEVKFLDQKREKKEAEPCFSTLSGEEVKFLWLFHHFLLLFSSWNVEHLHTLTFHIYVHLQIFTTFTHIYWCTTLPVHQSSGSFKSSL